MHGVSSKPTAKASLAQQFADITPCINLIPVAINTVGDLERVKQFDLIRKIDLLIAEMTEIHSESSAGNTFASSRLAILGSNEVGCDSATAEARQILKKAYIMKSSLEFTSFGHQNLERLGRQALSTSFHVKSLPLFL